LIGQTVSNHHILEELGGGKHGGEQPTGQSEPMLVENFR
jgi:hypothetical protein